MNKTIDLFIGVLVTILWGANFSVIELGLKDLDPFSLTFLRFTFCAFPLIFFIKKPEDVSLLKIAIYGVFFGVGLWWLVNFAMFNGLSAGLSSVFLQFSAFFTIILSSIFFKEKINLFHWIGIVVSFFGLSVMIYFHHEESTSKGIFFIICAALSWAVCNMIIKKSKPSNMIAFIVWSSLFSAPSVLFMAVLVKGFIVIEQIPQKVTIYSAFSVFFQAYITTIIGYMVWNNLMKKYPASDIAPLSLLVPVSGVISAYIFWDENLEFSQIVSVTLVLFGIFLFLYSSKLKSNPK